MVPVNKIEEAKVILAEAADYIAEHGWTQGDYRDDATGGVCALGAIWSTRDGILTVDEDDGRHKFLASIDVCDKALVLLSQHLNVGPPGAWGAHVPNWNDQPERTAEDVILALKGAANA